jgi:F-type H+-transporting ATPase subunit delta
LIGIDPVSTRWAAALFNLALGQSKVDAVGDDVARLGTELNSDAVKAYLLISSASDAEKLGKLEQVLVDCDELTAKFVRLLFEKGRVGVLEHLEAAFRARRLEHEGAVEGHVESARQLDDAQVTSLAAAMGARLGKQVTLEQRVNADLVGGVRVFVGANMIDQSVQGRLEGLRRKMVDARLPS